MSENTIAPLKSGDTIGNGRYSIESLIGQGGMGHVYICRREDLNNQIFAVKVLRPEVAADPQVMTRFRSEVITALEINHPNIVRGYDFLSDGSTTAYTMEFVDGGDLSQLIKKNPEAIALPDALRIIKEITAGVQALHKANIIHRDLKPENVLLTKEGRAKISDFGIAMIPHDSAHTSQGQILGTASYLSPEYLLHNQVDNRSDIYSIGILAYELITKQHPFAAEHVFQSMYKQIEYDFKPAAILRPDCPDSLDKVICRCLQSDPQNRYQNCEDLLKDLNKIIPLPRSRRLTKTLQSGNSGSIETESRKESYKPPVTEEVYEMPEISGTSRMVEDKDLANAKPKKTFLTFSSRLLRNSKLSPGKRILLIAIFTTLVGINIIVFLAIAPGIRQTYTAYFTDKDKSQPQEINKTVFATQRKADVSTKIKIRIEKGRVSSIEAEATPLINLKTQSDWQLTKATYNNPSIIESQGSIYRGTLTVTILYTKGKREKTIVTDSEFNAILFRDTGLLTLTLNPPKHLATERLISDTTSASDKSSPAFNLEIKETFNIYN